MNTKQMEGDWNITKGKLKQKYGELTDDDLMFTEGREDELWGRIQKKVGKTTEQIKEEISKL